MGGIMANCHFEFNKFLDEIELTVTEIENLKRGRDSLREKIKKYYEKKDKKKPSFCKQGSFAVKTTIRQTGEDYDYDDGIYLKHLPERKSDWPKTETVHEEIFNAIDGHTDSPPKDKTSCVRVQYKKEYHIDLAIYGENEGKIYLAKKGLEQWEENNPKLFTDWVIDKIKEEDEQLRSVIKYIKKWAYYNGYEEITGFLVTILVGKNFSGNADQDDQALLYTLDNIVSYLINNQKIERPVEPIKNMTADYSYSEFNAKFIDRFRHFADEARKALDVSDHNKACEIWRELFGDEFPRSDVEEKEQTRENFTQKITIETRPWGR